MENGKELISYAPEFPKQEDSFAVSFVKMVKLNMIEARKSFFEIGFRLYEAHQNKYYIELGFENLADCAEYHFGFKKTLVYDLINVYTTFSDGNSKFIKEKYKDFSQSQLIEMSKVRSIPVNFRNMCKPTDSVKKIREARKIYSKDCGLYISCKSLDEIFKSHDTQKSINLLESVVKESNEKNKSIPEVKDIKPIEVSYETKGIELIENAPEEEKVELTEDLMPYEDFRKELIKKLRSRSECSVWLIEDKLSHVKLQKISKDFLKVYFNVIKDNSKDIKKFITTQFEKYNYEINLHGRKQPLNVFISNIVNSFIDIFEPTKE